MKLLATLFDLLVAFMGESQKMNPPAGAGCHDAID